MRQVHLSKDPKEVQEGVNELSSRGNRQCEVFEAAAYFGSMFQTFSKEASRVGKGRGRGVVEEVRGHCVSARACEPLWIRKKASPLGEVGTTAGFRTEMICLDF